MSFFVVVLSFFSSSSFSVSGQVNRWERLDVGFDVGLDIVLGRRRLGRIRRGAVVVGSSSTVGVVTATGSVLISKPAEVLFELSFGHKTIVCSRTAF